MFNHPGVSVIDINAKNNPHALENPSQKYNKDQDNQPNFKNNIQIKKYSNQSGEISKQSSKKVPSIFKRLFKEKQQLNAVMQSQLYSSNFSSPNNNISHLKTNYSEGTLQGIIFDPSIQLPQFIHTNQLNQPARIIPSSNLVHSPQVILPPQQSQFKDACNKCLINPAEVSVTNLKENKSERLCSVCHQSSKQAKNYIKKADLVSKYKCVYREDEPKVETNQKTVIVMQGSKQVEKPNLNKVSVGLFQPVSSNLEETKNATNNKVGNDQQKKLRVSKLSFQPSFQKGKAKPNFQARIVTNTIKNWNNSSSLDNLAPNIENIFEGASSKSKEVLHEITPSNADVLYVNSSRPSAYNPGYRGTEENYPQMDLPTELEAPIQSTQFFSKIEEIRHNEMMQKQRLQETQENSSAPPR